MFRDELKPYTLAKGTIQFPTDKPLPAAIIKKMVKARLAQIAAKKAPVILRALPLSVVKKNRTAVDFAARRSS
jgi:hypothetical protein